MPRPLMLLGFIRLGDQGWTSIDAVEFEAYQQRGEGKYEIICGNESGHCRNSWVYNPDCNRDRARKQGGQNEWT